MSIRYKLMMAFLVVVLLAVGVAGYGIALVSSASSLTTRLYDEPLMAINHSRAAQLSFAKARNAIEKSILLREEVKPAEFAAIEKALKEFRSDINIVKERMARATGFDSGIDKIIPLVDDWYKVGMAYLKPPATGVVQLPLPQAVIAKGSAVAAEIDLIAENAGAYGYEFRAQAEADAESSRTHLMAVAGVTLVAGIAFAFLLAASLTRPLRALIGPLAEIAAGKLTVVIPGLGRKDEVGQVSAAVTAMIERMREVITGISVSTREVSSASAEISSSTTDLSQRTEEQAASLEETTASLEEIASIVRKNAENARQANTFAIETSTVAERGGTVVGDAVAAMARIEDSSRKIADIIGVIDEIARQTNLLALNAAVEAARAGEAGRGFAVVASEVRSLAQRSSQAAKDITNLITSSSNQVKDGVQLVNKAGVSLTEIVDSIKKVAVIVGEIANASNEQSSGIDQVNKALSQMDEVTQQNSALVEENAATAKTLEHQAQAMDEQVAFFKVEDDAEAAAPEVLEERPVYVPPSRGPAAKLMQRLRAA
jgi:methyl-accepting chemotaxis protein